MVVTIYPFWIIDKRLILVKLLLFVEFFESYCMSQYFYLKPLRRVLARSSVKSDVLYRKIAANVYQVKSIGFL